jgi:hypothetical protein
VKPLIPGAPVSLDNAPPDNRQRLGLLVVEAMRALEERKELLIALRLVMEAWDESQQVVDVRFANARIHARALLAKIEGPK